jgi:FKBP-type peptidyl-prolyl cis-trans isomerase FkpA
MFRSKKSTIQLAVIALFAAISAPIVSAQSVAERADKIAAEVQASATGKVAPEKMPTVNPVKFKIPLAVNELITHDIQFGKGKLAETNRAVLMHYTGWLYDASKPDGKGKKFDSSKDRGQPFSTMIGVGRVIKGWDQGVPGMQVGGQRILLIPPDMGYGAKDVGNGLIPANSTLMFEVELIDVIGGKVPEAKPAAAPATAAPATAAPTTVAK